MFYQDGRAGLRPDAAQAEKWYRSAADHGSAEAQSNLGMLLESRGEGEVAARLYRQAAVKGVAQAQFNFARCLEFGIGIEKNVPAAISWYRKAADQNNPKAVARLASLETAYRP